MISWNGMQINAKYNHTWNPSHSIRKRIEMHRKDCIWTKLYSFEIFMNINMLILYTRLYYTDLNVNLIDYESLNICNKSKYKLQML